MGKRRGKKSRAKKVDDRLRLRSSVRSDGSQVVPRNLSDVDVIQNRERPRPSSPGIFRSVFGVVMCSMLCLFVTWLILNLWLAVSDGDVISELFKGLNGQAYNQGVVGLTSLLAGIATIALTLRGMSWEPREVPMDSSLHRAWLQKVIDDSAREGWAFFLLILLSGLYGAAVVTYGVLGGYNGWPGISRVLLIFLSVMYVVVAALPAFVPKSDIGTINGYVRSLVRLANMGEWRYFNSYDSELCAKKDGVVRFFVARGVVRVLCVEDIKSRWHLVVRFSGLWGMMLVFAVLVVTDFVRIGGVKMSFIFIFYVIFVCFIPEFMLVWILGLRCRVVAMREIGVDVVVEGGYVVFLSLLPWGVQLYFMPGPFFKGVVAVLFFWWFVRAVLASSMKSERRRWPSGVWERLSVVAGMRCVMGVHVNRELQEERNRVISYRDENAQVANELSVAAGLIIPEKYIVHRFRDNGEIESKSLRNYLSEVVKVTLPPVPESGSVTGNQGE